MTERQEKLFAGARLRRLRKDIGQTQAQFAEALGVSASYLNLLERNQRPVTARVLLSLAQAFDIDVRAFASEGDRQILADLDALARDPVLKGVDLDQRDLRDLVDANPRAADALSRLYQAWREASTSASDLAAQMAGGAGDGAVVSPLEEVRDALDGRQNHFPDLEAVAETLRAGLDPDMPLELALSQRLRTEHGAAVRLYDDEVMDGALRRFDFHARKLLLSEHLSAEGRVFHIAATLGLLEAGDVLDEEAARANFSGDGADQLYRAALSNYLAAAIMMPYDAFYRMAEKTRYDIDAIARRFQASFEQVCHRLTTLNRPGSRGIPFFMIRVDQAGNVTKRFGGGVIPFARSSGGCARWRLHDAFRMPERIHVNLIELPDRMRFVSVAKAVTRPLPGGSVQMQTLALGCEAKEAERLVYRVPDFEAPLEVGLSCRLCERRGCAERAFPPLQRKLRLDPHVRGRAPFTFGEE